MTLLYKCNKCGVAGEPNCGNELPDDWGYEEDSDLCPDCLSSYGELEEAHTKTWKGKLEAWFKETK